MNNRTLKAASQNIPLLDAASRQDMDSESLVIPTENGMSETNSCFDTISRLK